jgi:hypothetical protein
MSGMQWSGVNALGHIDLVHNRPSRNRGSTLHQRDNFSAETVLLMCLPRTSAVGATCRSFAIGPPLIGGGDLRECGNNCESRQTLVSWRLGHAWPVACPEVSQMVV